MVKLIMAFVLLILTAPAVGGAYGTGQNPTGRFSDAETELRYHLDKNFMNPNWIRVAKLESGTGFDSYVAQQANNFFGMHTVRKRRTTSVGSVSFYARYSTIAEAITDLRYWAEVNPQRPGERFDHWLRRRHWNPNPGYYAYLQSIPM
jgi:hypothetical protein